MKIVIAYDGSAHANAAVEDLQWAGLPRKAQATVISVVEDGIPAPRSYGMVETDFADDRVVTAERWAEDACNRLTNYFPHWDVRMETRWGNAAPIILDKAKDWPADLVVVGTHGRSKLGRVLLGSVSQKVLHEAACSVRVGRAGWHDVPLRLLVGNDGSPRVDAVVEAICKRSWPAGTQVRVTAVHEALVPIHSERIAIGTAVYTEINEEERHRLKYVANSSVERLEKARLIATAAVMEGDPKDVLLHEARTWRADSIFVGARGLGRIERLLLGSVSSAIVTQAPCTVEVVREEAISYGGSYEN